MKTPNWVRNASDEGLLTLYYSLLYSDWDVGDAEDLNKVEKEISRRKLKVAPNKK